MVNNTSLAHPELKSAFKGLSTDQQLAYLWFVYKEVGKSVTPAAPGASTASPAIAEGLFKQVLEMSQEEQLQVQREIVEGQNSLVSREYGALSDTTKLLFWYLLAQGMDRKEVIPMPEDYSLEDQGKQCLQQLQQLEHSEQITALRELVGEMGVADSSAQDSATGI